MANAILSQRRAIRDDVATITAKTLGITGYPEESEFPERKAFVLTLARDIVVMPGKATIVYTIPTLDDSPVGCVHCRGRPQGASCEFSRCSWGWHDSNSRPRRSQLDSHTIWVRSNATATNQRGNRV